MCVCLCVCVCTVRVAGADWGQTHLQNLASRLGGLRGCGGERVPPLIMACVITCVFVCLCVCVLELVCISVCNYGEE